MSTKNILLQVTDGHKSFGPKVLFDSASFAINEGEHIGLIGPNGAGKSTLFKILVNDLELDSGKITKTAGLKIGYLRQEDQFNTESTIEDLLTTHCSLPLWELKSLAKGLGLLEDHFLCSYKSLSGGYRMRFKLLMLLGQEPNLLLLDEPTNYLDLESLIILEKFLVEFKGAFLLISHDREFLRQTTDTILEIENGLFSKFFGNIDDYFEQKAAILEIERKHAQNVAEKKQQIQKFADRFRAKATKAKQVQSRLKQLNKMESVELRALPVKAKINIPEPTHTGRVILEVDGLDAGYSNGKPILKEVNLLINKGDHIGVVGVNGAGKTTLLKTLANELPPLAGEFKLGLNVKIGYYAQHVPEALDLNQTVIEAIQAKAHKDSTLQDARDMAGALLFSGEDIDKKVRLLSGGEKARVALGQILLERVPFLILDEPTNHLDFHTVEALTLALKSYKGSLVTVSHDRSFIGRVAKKILEIRDGKAEVYPGTYDEYVWSLQKGAWSDKKSDPLNHASNPDTPKKTEVSKKNLSKLIRTKKVEIRDCQKLMEQKEKIARETLDGLAKLNGVEASQAQIELAKHQNELDQLEETWLSLNEELEKLEDQS